MVSRERLITGDAQEGILQLPAHSGTVVRRTWQQISARREVLALPRSRDFNHNVRGPFCLTIQAGHDQRARPDLLPKAVAHDDQLTRYVDINIAGRARADTGYDVGGRGVLLSDGAVAWAESISHGGAGAFAVAVFGTDIKHHPVDRLDSCGGGVLAQVSCCITASLLRLPSGKTVEWNYSPDGQQPANLTASHALY